jgi:hypothetical protein
MFMMGPMASIKSRHAAKRLLGEKESSWNLCRIVHTLHFGDVCSHLSVVKHRDSREQKLIRVLVYRNELYRAATVAPIISHGSGSRLTDDQLQEAATRLYPGYRVVNLGRARNLDQAVDIAGK